MPWIESGGCLICVKMDAEIGETLRELGVFGGRRCAYDTENGFVLRSQKKNHIFCVCVCGGAHQYLHFCWVFAGQWHVELSD